MRHESSEARTLPATTGSGWLLLVGGTLFAIGAAALGIRKGEDWGDLALLAVVGIPFLLLYGLGIAERGALVRGGSWRSVFLVFAIVLGNLTLFQFLALVGGDAGRPLHAAWIFLVTAALAGYASLRARSLPGPPDSARHPDRLPLRLR